MTPTAPSVKVAIIGAGFAGHRHGDPAQAGGRARLRRPRARRQGRRHLARQLAIPAAPCDVESHLYSFSFAPNPEWTQLYSPQAEIWDYLRRLVEQYDLRAAPALRRTRSLGGDWDGDAGVWHVRTSAGPVDARFLVSGMGPLTNPVAAADPRPRELRRDVLPLGALGPRPRPHRRSRGGDRHRRRRRRSSFPRSRRDVERLLVFQRTPAWLIPRMNRRITGIERSALPAVPARCSAPCAPSRWSSTSSLGLLAPDPATGEAHRVRRQGEAQAPGRGPGPAREADAGYRAGCKRLIIADDWYPALARPNVDVVTEAITEVRPEGIVTADGTVHAVDTLILGTGFEIMPVADPLRGRDGVSLAERWAQASRGIPGHDRRGLSELLHARGAEHRDGPHLGPALRGGADRVRAPVPAARRAQRRASDRGPRGDAARVLGGDPREAPGDRLAPRRLRLLVPQRARRHFGAVARHDVGVRRRPEATQPADYELDWAPSAEPAAQPVAA